MKWFVFTVFLAACFILPKCDLPEGGPGWEPNYYGPIAKSEVFIEDVSKLEDLIFEQDVPVQDINSQFQGEYDSVPAFSLNRKVGPYEFEISEIFRKIAADSLVFRISYKNVFPIDLAEGTVLSFRNKSDTSQEIFRHRIEEDIEPGEEFSIERIVTDKVVDNNINFYLENFTSNGSDDPVDFGQGLEATFVFELIFLKIAELEIETGQEYVLQDTTDFNYEERSGEGSAEGELYVFFENKFPLEFSAQLYLLDENRRLQDSLFESRINLGSPALVKEGNLGRIPQSESAVLSIDTVKLVDENLRALKNAEYISGYFDVSTVDTTEQGDPLGVVAINITDQSFLELQIGGDVEGIANP